MNSTILLSGISGFTLAAAAFANPSYLNGTDGGLGLSSGFEINGAGYVVLAFSGTYTGLVVAHEQTLDPRGLSDWFSVQGANNSGGAATSTGSTSGAAYVFPVLGVRHRVKVTALSTGSVVLRAMMSEAGGSGGSGGSSGGGGAVTIADGANVAQGTTTDTAWNGIAAAATEIALLKAIYAASITGGAATIANGADVTQGAIADAAWASGNGTVVALLKTIAQGALTPASQASTIVNGGDVTQGAIADAAWALTGNGTQIAIEKAMSLALGTIADAAWASGSGSAIALLKTIATQVLSTAAQLTIPGGRNYETVAASQTAQVLGGSGATGDVIDGVLIIPGTTSPGNVLLLDNATSITIFTGGATSVSNLVPFFIPLGAASVSGAWKLTTGANVTAIGVGKFT